MIDVILKGLFLLLLLLLLCLFIDEERKSVCSYVCLYTRLENEQTRIVSGSFPLKKQSRSILDMNLEFCVFIAMKKTRKHTLLCSSQKKDWEKETEKCTKPYTHFSCTLL